LLGGETRIISVEIPFDCRDGFNEAYYGRPERLLEMAARRACSAWSFVDDREEQLAVQALDADLASGAWDRRYGSLRSLPAYDGSLRLLINTAPG
jgi:hypothetical protein